MTRKKIKQKDKLYENIHNEHKLSKVELWIEHLKAPGFIKFILLILYHIIIFPIEILNDIKSIVFWIYVLLAPFIIIWWVFTMIRFFLGHH